MGVALGRNLIKSMNGKMLSVTRYYVGEYVEGVYVAQSPQVVQVLATVVPLSASDIKQLPEGARSSDSRKLFSADLLQVIDQESKRKADIVSIDGRPYKVISVATWPNYWEAVAVLQNEPDDAEEPDDEEEEG